MAKRKLPIQDVISKVPRPPTDVDRVNAKAIVEMLTEALAHNKLISIVGSNTFQYLPTCVTIVLRDAARLVVDGYNPGVLDVTRLSSSDVAKLLGCSRACVQDLTARGKLPYTRTPGGHRRFKLDDVNEYIRGIR